MQSFSMRAGRFRLASSLLSLVALGACADEPVAPRIPSITKPAMSGAPTGEWVDVTVTNSSGGTEVGSIRWAANQIQDRGGVIRFASSLGGATIVLNGTLSPDGPMYIEGPAQGITISGNDQHRVISGHPDDGGVSLKNVTITKGYRADYAAAIWATSLSMENSTVQDSRGAGSAIRVLYGFYSSNSTISRNTVGGMALEYGPNAQLDINNTTIAFNAAAAGIGPYAYPSYSLRVTLRNSILSNNGAQNCSNFFGIGYEGKNISSDWSCGEVDITVADPKLLPLANNGGPSMTHAIPHTSPAYNTGVCFFVTTDQRYVPRDAKCDVGAFEFNDFTKVTITIDPTARFDATYGYALLTGTMKCTRDDVIPLALELHQDQKMGKDIVDVHSAATTQVWCNTTGTTWARKMFLAPGEAWQTGAARATANTFNTPEWVTPAGVASGVKISRR